jgi:GMP synthase-like glutamine amidotransferase
MRFLVLQHIDCEHPGIFRDLMRAAGVAWDPVELDAGEEIPDTRGYDALLVMGGPMDVWQVDENPWLKDEMAAIRKWVETGRPYLGFCLGHQLLAEAMGGAVGPARQPEIGVLPVSLTDAGRNHWFFRGCPDELMTLQWHSAEVTTLPPGGISLARSDACAVNAMALGDNAVSVQFHIELTDTTVADWGQVPEYAVALEKSLGSAGLGEMQAAADRNMEGFQRVSQNLFDNFLSRIR